jgi:hypothetical protein
VSARAVGDARRAAWRTCCGDHNIAALLPTAHSSLSERWSNARRRSVTCKTRAHRQEDSRRAIYRGGPWSKPDGPGALPVGITLFAIGRIVMAWMACNSDSVIVPGKIRASAPSSQRDQCSITHEYGSPRTCCHVRVRTHLLFSAPCARACCRFARGSSCFDSAERSTQP